MRHVTRATLLLAVLVLAPAVARAQALGTIAGSVKDASGAVLPGVTVEAASPALIEKVRTVTTDGTGLYRIVNLPPGTYTLTFTLPGFNTVRRADVEVATSFTATIDADMRVGAIEETVTVTGESPIVDVQSAAQTRSMTAEVFKTIPSSGSWLQMASMVPAVRASVQDVGGVLGDQTGAQVSAHGSRAEDGVSMIDGLRIGNMYQSSNLTNMSLSPLLFEQVDVQLAGQMAETGTNGVIMNAIPRSGGNTFRGTVLVNGSHPNLQGSNVTERLNQRGLAGASTTLKALYDLNGALGGPIARDRVWFYATSRYFKNEYFLASRFYPADVTAVRRQPDLARQAYGGTYTYDNNGRVTWNISNKQKFTSWYAYQYKVDPHWLIQVQTTSPEAARVTTWNTQLSTSKWTYTATNRLLFEVGLMAGESPDTIKADLTRIGGISITDQSTNLVYRAPTGFDFDDRLPSQSVTGSMSYVTGSHNAKFGLEMQRGHFWRGDNNDSTGGIWYFINNQTAAAPTQVTVQAPVYGYQNNLNYNLGIYAQDRWTIDRLTLSGGVRLDMLNESTEPVVAGPHKWLPDRNRAFAAVEDVPNWKDVNPRLSVAYDVFGTGKTALKASASRGVEQDSLRYAAANNPASTLQTSANRSWNDSFFGLGDPRTGNFTPDCDLRVGTANGECGAWAGASLNFGNPNPSTTYDRAIMEGWGARPWNWEFSVGVQQEIVPRVSATFGYYRRVNGNFNVLDNEALAANEYTEFSVTRPGTDPRLPGGGQSLGGFFDANRNVAAKNVIKDAGQFGKWQQHFDGVDLTVDARLQNGLFLQGGVSTGNTMVDICDIADDVPEMLQGQGGAGLQPLVSAGGGWLSREFCHQESGFLPQYKAIASYTLPYDVRISGTFQSIPGPQIAANAIYSETSATLPRATMTTLGRPLTGLGQASLSLIEPGSLYGDRLNQIDLRFTKIVGVGRGRVDLNVDVYNAFNSDAILGQLNNFGPAWQLPLTVIQPRFVKFSARWDF